MQSEIKDSQELSIVRDLADRMADPLSVRTIASEPLQITSTIPYPMWNDLSLANGYPSLVIFYQELHRQFPDQRWDYIAHDYIKKIIECIETTGIQNASLFGGLAGICYAISLASLQNKRYKNLLHQLQALLVKVLQKHYLSPLENDIKKGQPSSPFFYELIQGITGIGIHFLTHKDEPQLFPVLIKLIRLLINRTLPIQVRDRIVPGWYIPLEYQFTDEDKKNFPDGNFNLGLAHGIPGILAFLSLASIKGICLQGQTSAIIEIVKWIKRHSITKEEGLDWPACVLWDRPLHPRSPSHRMAWCYGKPSILRSLFLAGLALKDRDLQQLSLVNFKSIFKGSEANWNLQSPTFCHGLAGLYTLTKHMAKDTKDHELQKEANHLKQELMQYYNPDLPFGFQDLECEECDKHLFFQKPGLLDGSAGIALALLDSIYPAKSAWQNLFLMT